MVCKWTCGLWRNVVRRNCWQWATTDTGLSQYLTMNMLWSGELKMYDIIFYINHPRKMIWYLMITQYQGGWDADCLTGYQGNLWLSCKDNSCWTQRSWVWAILLRAILILLEAKVISLCNQYRARPASAFMQSDLYCWLTNIKFSSWYPWKW